MVKSTIDAGLNMDNVSKRVAMMRKPSAKRAEQALEYLHQNVWPYLLKIDIVRLAHGDTRFMLAVEQEHRQDQVLKACGL